MVLSSVFIAAQHRMWQDKNKQAGIDGGSLYCAYLTRWESMAMLTCVKWKNVDDCCLTLECLYEWVTFRAIFLCADVVRNSCEYLNCSFVVRQSRLRGHLQDS